MRVPQGVIPVMVWAAAGRADAGRGVGVGRVDAAIMERRDAPDLAGARAGGHYAQTIEVLVPDLKVAAIYPIDE